MDISGELICFCLLAIDDSCTKPDHQGWDAVLIIKVLSLFSKLKFRARSLTVNVSSSFILAAFTHLIFCAQSDVQVVEAYP